MACLKYFLDAQPKLVNSGGRYARAVFNYDLPLQAQMYKIHPNTTSIF